MTHARPVPAAPATSPAPRPGLSFLLPWLGTCMGQATVPRAPASAWPPQTLPRAVLSAHPGPQALSPTHSHAALTASRRQSRLSSSRQASSRSSRARCCFRTAWVSSFAGDTGLLGPAGDGAMCSGEPVPAGAAPAGSQSHACPDGGPAATAPRHSRKPARLLLPHGPVTAARTGRPASLVRGGAGQAVIWTHPFPSHPRPLPAFPDAAPALSLTRTHTTHTSSLWSSVQTSPHWAHQLAPARALAPHPNQIRFSSF